MASIGLVLQNNGTESLSISANGVFQFATPLATGSTYHVTVLSQPSNPVQTCQVTNATGVIGNSAVATVSVSCTTNGDFLIGVVSGRVTGLSSSGLILANGADSRSISSNGLFTFPLSLPIGASYNVTVEAQPVGSESCIVSNGSGIGTANTSTNVLVSCFVQPSFSYQLSDIVANDIAWSPNGKLYLALSSSSSIAPNTVSAFDPVTGTLGPSVFVGSEPVSLSASDDGQYLYVGFLGAQVAKRLTLPMLAVDISMPIGQFDVVDNQSADPQFATQIIAAPGASRTVGVLARDPQGSTSQGNIFVYDDAVQRGVYRLGGPAGTSFQWGNNATTIYSANGATSSLDLLVYSVNSQGLQLRNSFPNVLPDFYTNLSFFNGQLYTNALSNGIYNLNEVIDPLTGRSIGRFPLRGPVTVDAVNNKTFIAASGRNFNVTIHAFDRQTLAELAVAKMPTFFGTAEKIIRWGTDGLAMIINNGRLVILSGQFVAPGGTGIASAVTGPKTNVALVPLSQAPIDTQANDIAWDVTRRVLYASVPSVAPVHSNSIASVDPHSGQVLGYTDLSFTPGILAVSSDGQYLYVASLSDDSIRRLHLPLLTADITIPLNSAPLSSGNIMVAPDAPNTILVSWNGVDGIRVYDDAMMRTSLSGIQGGWGEWGDSVTKLYTFGNNDSGFRMSEYAISATGFSVTNATPLALSTVFFFPYQTTFKQVGGIVYGDTGSVWNPITRSIVGVFPVTVPGRVAVDIPHNRVFFASTRGLESFDATRYTPVLRGVFSAFLNSSITRLVQTDRSSFAMVTGAQEVIILSDPVLGQ